MNIPQAINFLIAKSAIEKITSIGCKPSGLILANTNGTGIMLASHPDNTAYEIKFKADMVAIFSRYVNNPLGIPTPIKYEMPKEWNEKNMHQTVIYYKIIATLNESH